MVLRGRRLAPGSAIPCHFLELIWSSAMRKPRDARRDVIPYRVAEAKSPLGLYAAIILAQLRYWLQRTSFVGDDGRSWIHKSYREWSDETGLTHSQARRGCKILKMHHVIDATERYSDPRKGPPTRKWYAINKNQVSPETPGQDGAKCHTEHLVQINQVSPATGQVSPATGFKETTIETTDTETTKPQSGPIKKDPVPENGRPPCKHGHVHHGPCHDKLCREAGCFELVPKIKLGPSPLVDDEEGLEDPF